MNQEVIRALWSQFLADLTLSEEQEAQLLEGLEGHAELREELMADAELASSLQAFGGSRRGQEAFARAFLDCLAAKRAETDFIRKVKARLPSEKGAGGHGGGGSRQGDRNPQTTRRWNSKRERSHAGPWTLVFAAAAALVAVTLFLVLRSSEQDPTASPKGKKTPVRGAKEPGERDLEQAQALAERNRLLQELQLREIEEKRRALTQAPPAVEGPQAKKKREKDLEALQRDQLRIEQELREAAELALKSQRPAPALAPQEEKPQPVSAPAAVPSQGTTQAAIAKVEEIAGDAFLVTKEGKSPLVSGANVFSTDRLLTGGGGSRIVLRFSDRTRVDLGPETMLAELNTDSGKRLSLAQGTARAVVAKQPKGEPLIFTTPHGQAKVVGTTLRLVVDPDPKTGTRLEVEEGRVELKNLAGKTVSVESGHYAVAAVGVEPVARVLPPRPRPAGFIWRGETAKAWGAILQTVSLVPNQTYTLSVWIRTNTPFPGGSIGIRTESGSILAQQPFGASESYSRTVLTFKSGSTSTAVIFVGFANPTNADSYIHVDDWSLVAQGGDGTNLIQDPDYKGQNQVSNGPLSGPWFTEGPLENGGTRAIGVDPIQGRIPKGSSGGERK
ncbi:MAG TPA: FecR domain-containing protein [Planctomycetota bacterium]|nr:FecR domain-containing protein [Planctomycetota bacterium]